jgi:pimeloyl-ACP methyl ester carboxylesterase
MELQPDADFSESFVEADGFRIRYCEAGQGDVLVCLHGAGGLRLSRAHAALAVRRRVVAFEIPGFGQSPPNDRSASLEDLARTMNAAVAALGIGRRALWGNSFGSKLALWMAIAQPDAVDSVVLVAPTAIRLDPPPSVPGPPPSGPAALLYAHPDRHPTYVPPAAEVEAKHRALVRRLMGPPRDADFEARLRTLETPVLALFGTEDRVAPCEAAGLYRSAMPNCHVVIVYDAAHAVDADRPEAVTTVVEDFLARHERFLVRQTSGLMYP